jgi:hypothetical protein
MSAREMLHAALVARLTAHAPLREAVTAVCDAPPLRSARPYALVEEPLLADWSTKDLAGREARVTILLFDEGERPVRLRALAGEVEAAMAELPGDLGGGWRVAALALLRSRIVRDGERRWAAMTEYRVRMLREN